MARCDVATVCPQWHSVLWLLRVHYNSTVVQCAVATVLPTLEHYHVGHCDTSTSEQIKEDDHVTSDTLNKLTLYIQQLRSFLPEAPSSVSRRGGEEEGVTETLTSEHKDSEDYVTTFMDKALVSDWDRVNPKVSVELTPR